MRLAHFRSQSLFGMLVIFFLGYMTSVFANQKGPKTYTSKGTVTQNQDGKLVIRDKNGQEWEYSLQKGMSPTKGQNVKVSYTMNASKIETE